MNKPKILFITLALLSIFLVQARAEEVCIPCIIQIESSGNPNAVSQDGCIGLMQVSLSAYDEFYQKACRELGRKMAYDPRELFDPEFNQVVGTWYVNVRIPEMLQAYKIPDTINNRLIAYNWGIGNLRKYLQGKKTMPKETRNYIAKYHKLVGAK